MTGSTRSLREPQRRGPSTRRSFLYAVTVSQTCWSSGKRPPQTRPARPSEATDGVGAGGAGGGRFTQGQLER